MTYLSITRKVAQAAIAASILVTLLSSSVFAEIAFFGRDYDTYKNMFCLSDDDIKNQRILDVAAGPSTFLGELNIKGWLHPDSKGVDLAYGPIAEMERSIEQGMKQAFSPFYDGSYKKWPQAQQESMERKHRDFTAIHQSFLAYYQKFPGLYIPGDVRKLPELFVNKPKFDWILSSNLLFLYSEQEKELDEAFHQDAILRMTEVLHDKGEIRLFPLDNFSAKTPAFLDHLVEELRNRHLKVELRKGCAPSVGQLMRRQTDTQGLMMVIRRGE